MLKHEMLLSEKLRPTQISDLLLPSRLMGELESFINGERMMNLAFIGRPGTGKTTVARLISKNYDTLTLNGADRRAGLVGKIQSFSSTSSLYEKSKLIVIEEADAMNVRDQDILRYEIESVPDSCRFLLTMNDDCKLSSPLRSRCAPIYFDLTRAELANIKEEAVQFYSNRMDKIGAYYDCEHIEFLIYRCLPDYRALANQLELLYGCS